MLKTRNIFIVFYRVIGREIFLPIYIRLLNIRITWRSNGSRYIKIYKIRNIDKRLTNGVDTFYQTLLTARNFYFINNIRNSTYQSVPPACHVTRRSIIELVVFLFRKSYWQQFLAELYGNSQLCSRKIRYNYIFISKRFLNTILYNTMFPLYG